MFVKVHSGGETSRLRTRTKATPVSAARRTFEELVDKPEVAKGKVLVTNWHRFSPEAEAITVGGVQVGRLGEETPEAFVRARLGIISARSLLVESVREPG